MSVISRLLRRPEAAAVVVVEPMRRRDVPQIMAIEQDSYPQPWTAGVFQSEIELSRRGERCYVVARLDGQVVGYGGLMFAVGEAHVTNIACGSAHQRTGVGTRLLAELAWEAITRECTALTLEVRVSNTAARALYQRFGFAPAGVRQRYYENTEDAIVMWCHGIDEPAYGERLSTLCPEAVRA